jgi:hypothetical protein
MFGRVLIMRVSIENDAGPRLPLAVWRRACQGYRPVARKLQWASEAGQAGVLASLRRAPMSKPIRTPSRAIDLRIAPSASNREHH